jgi:hypothetical protein
MSVGKIMVIAGGVDALPLHVLGMLADLMKTMVKQMLIVASRKEIYPGLHEVGQR